MCWQPEQVNTLSRFPEHEIGPVIISAGRLHFIRNVVRPGRQTVRNRRWRLGRSCRGQQGERDREP